MRVSEWMTQSPIAVAPSTPAHEARALMRGRGIRHLLVTEAAELVGIVSDRDLRLNINGLAGGLSVWEINHVLATLTVGEVMAKRIVTAEPALSLEAAARLMLEHRIGALPVLEDGRIAGILTETDLRRALIALLSEMASGESPPAVSARSAAAQWWLPSTPDASRRREGGVGPAERRADVTG